jgi:hypothetical protein
LGKPPSPPSQLFSAGDISYRMLSEPSKFQAVQTPQAILGQRRNRDPLTLSSGLLRAGLALKLSPIKLATRSYLRDRTHQATSSASAYATGAGLFAAASVFLIAACLVGAAALFRWIEFKYGLFSAFEPWV